MLFVFLIFLAFLLLLFFFLLFLLLPFLLACIVWVVWIFFAVRAVLTGLSLQRPESGKYLGTRYLKYYITNESDLLSGSLWFFAEWAIVQFRIVSVVSPTALWCNLSTSLFVRRIVLIFKLIMNKFTKSFYTEKVYHFLTLPFDWDLLVLRERRFC